MPTTDWGAFGAHDRPPPAEPSTTGDDAQERIAWALSSLAARLEASEENFRTFIETVEDIVVVGSLDGRIVYANPALKRKLGYSAGDVRSMRLPDLYPAGVRAEADAVYAEMWHGERATCPLPLQAKSGSLLPVETRVRFGRWNDEDCVFAICKDLSAEQEALQKFDRLFRLNPCPMAVSGVADRAFTDVNDAWLRLLGYERSEVIGRTMRDLDLFVDREAHRRVGDLLQEAGSVVDVDLQVRRKDGSILYGVFSGEVIESQGRRHALTVMVDHTEVKQAREAFVRAARISETVGLAVRSTAGELEVLLEVISGAVARLGEELPPGDQCRTMLASIDDAARRSADLTGRLAGSGSGGSGE